MTAEERIAQLEMELARERAKTARVEAERASERAENASLRKPMEQVLARLSKVEGQLAKDSHTSLKPPSSDSPGRKQQSQRHKSEKQASRGNFPTGVEAPVQYGPNLRALAVYLHQYQLVPLSRTCELLCDHCDCQLSEGTLTAWVQQAAQTLAPTVERIADRVSASRVQHGDETGARVGGKLHWMHVNSTQWLTHLAWHAKRGKQALEAIGIWPRFHGRGMHDRFASYDQYACQHSVCGAHLLRDCLYLYEQDQQVWAHQMHDLLLEMHAAAQVWRHRGAP